MQTAFIIMSILGCDDTATQCHFVEMLDERWVSIQACDAGSEARLRRYSNLNYPVVVAVCQTPDDAGLADVGDEPAEDAVVSIQPDQAKASEEMPLPKADIPVAAPDTAAGETLAMEQHPGMTSRVFTLVREALPEAVSLKALVSKPAHVVTDSYSWVAQRFEK
ncbi:hypothetical protein PZ897_17485 [Hoeflea sp. YIM 152468]|uniref:hypothetical protein n=1 Tax=Hoeflea sp. YIM 152468 TaxID=3031759 RepID=UPI0023DC7406|nr:hypothetical protein [Hoeflea sp. YIM 152468]MDF1609976.1 hypothetical protein [Hoeflea sp. YIM 152468]